MVECRQIPVRPWLLLSLELHDRLVLDFLSMIPFIVRSFYKTTTDGLKIVRDLIQVMIPILIVMKVLEHLGFIQILSELLDPLMSLMGLPGNMGLVWATAMASNIYGAIAVFSILIRSAPEVGSVLTIAQITTLMSVVLMVHNLPIEQKIISRMGIKILPITIFRISLGFSYGVILYHLYNQFQWLQVAPNENTLTILNQLALKSSSNINLFASPMFNELLNWAIENMKFLISMSGVVMILIYMLKLLEITGITPLLLKLLGVVLQPFGIGKEVRLITTIGILLGIACSGGLFMSEVKNKSLNPKDVFVVMAFLSLSHALIEDTLLVMITGADLSGILWGRIIFTYSVILILSRVVEKLSRKKFHHLQHFWTSNS